MPRPPFQSLLCIAVLMAATGRCAAADVQTALNAKSEVEFLDTPFPEVIKHLAELHGIRIVLDEASLKEQGISHETPVTFVLSGVTLRSVLNLMLEQEGLAYEIEGRDVHVYALKAATAPAQEPSDVQRSRNGEIRRALNQPGRFHFLETPLRDVLGRLSDVSGVPVVIDHRGCRMAKIDLTVSVTETFKVVPMEQTLKNVLKPLGLRAVVRDEVLFVTPAKQRDPKVALNGRVAFEFLEVPFDEAIEFLSDLCDVRIEIDNAALARANVEHDMPITLKAGDAPLESALTTMLKPHGLTYKVDKTIVITDQP